MCVNRSFGERRWKHTNNIHRFARIYSRAKKSLTVECNSHCDTSYCSLLPDLRTHVPRLYMWLVFQLCFFSFSIVLYYKKQKSNAFNKRNRFPRLKHSTIQPVSSICVDSGVQLIFFHSLFHFLCLFFLFLYIFFVWFFSLLHEKESGADEKQQLLLNLWENEIATASSISTYAMKCCVGPKNLGTRCSTRHSFG